MDNSLLFTLIKNKIMKSLSKYFDTCSLWVIFGLTYVSTLVIFFVMFYLFINNMTNEIFIVLIKIFLLLGFLFSCLASITVSNSRKSDIFWKYRDEVETLINDTYNVDELNDLINVEIKKLWKMSQGGIHSQDVNRLVSLINIKIKTIVNLKP